MIKKKLKKCQAFQIKNSQFAFKKVHQALTFRKAKIETQKSYLKIRNLAKKTLANLKGKAKRHKMHNSQTILMAFNLILITLFKLFKITRSVYF